MVCVDRIKTDSVPSFFLRSHFALLTLMRVDFDKLLTAYCLTVGKLLVILSVAVNSHSKKRKCETSSMG